MMAQIRSLFIESFSDIRPIIILWSLSKLFLIRRRIKNLPVKFGIRTNEKRRWSVIIAGGRILSRMIGRRAGTNRVGMRREDSLLTRFVDSVFYYFRLAEFEILFVLFILITYIIFKDLVNSSEYPISFNQLDFDSGSHIFSCSFAPLLLFFCRRRGRSTIGFLWRNPVDLTSGRSK